MKINYIYAAILFVALSTAQSMQALIVRGEILRKQRPDGTMHYVYGLSDMHYVNALSDRMVLAQVDADFLSQESRAQLKLLIDHFRAMRDQRLKILVEDPYTNEEGELLIVDTFAKALERNQQAKFELLLGIAQSLKEAGLPVKNVDFRQWRSLNNSYLSLLETTYTYQMLATNPIVQQNLVRMGITGVDMIANAKKMYENNYNHGITMEALIQQKTDYDLSLAYHIQDFENTIREVNSYQDDSILSAYYSREIDVIRASGRETLQKMKEAGDTLFSEFSNWLGDKKSIFCASYPPSYGQSMLDIRALHEIYKSFDSTDRIFFIAGGSHIENVCRMLYKIGYERVREEGISADDVISFSEQLISLSELDRNMAMSLEAFTQSQINEKVNELIVKILNQRPIFDMEFFHTFSLENPS